jgi:hypothetical protein
MQEVIRVLNLQFVLSVQTADCHSTRNSGFTCGLWAQNGVLKVTGQRMYMYHYAVTRTQKEKIWRCTCGTHSHRAANTRNRIFTQTHAGPSENLGIFLLWAP